MSLNLKSKLSIRDQWAHEHAIRGVKEVWNKRLASIPPGLPGTPTPIKGNELPVAPAPKLTHAPVAGEPDKAFKVGIVGAGAAGLFTGLILDFLNYKLKGEPKETKFNVTYDILEASNKDRLGGRLYTYNFVPNGTENPQGPHDYYDVGAMRFPDNPIMTRTFALFKTLGMEKKDPKTSNLPPPDGSLIPYYMANASTEPWCYNDITKWGNYDQITAQAANKDPFLMNTDGGIPLDVFKYKPDDVMNYTIDPLRKKLREDAESSPPGTAGWDLLMKYDGCSTRQFLSIPPPEPLDPSSPIAPPPYNYDTIEWMETFNGGTNWYDQAHSETVLESLDFEYDDSTNWYCILGGAQQLAIKMEATLQQKPTYESRVTAIRAMGTNKMEVDFGDANGKHTNTYAGVFNSTTLGCLKRMDTSLAGLNYATKQAIRSLGYGASSKVGIKFKRAWWIHDLKDYNITQGGLGHSDLTIRTCVYPSYNLYDPEDQPAVLLCSYTWQQDGQRIAALISNASDHTQKLADEADLKELLIRELTRLHQNDKMTVDDLYKLINDNYLDHHAYDWYHDPNTVGAFAFFRPQQFSSMWNKMIQPSGDLVIIGEAASPHHAWVVGALESAVHGMHAWLGLNQTTIPGAKKAMELLETIDPSNPFVGLPKYMEPNISAWHALLARATRDDHLDMIKKVLGKGGKHSLPERLVPRKT